MRRVPHRFLLLLSLAAALCLPRAGAETRYPAPGYTEKPHPCANPDAPKGGRIVLNGHNPPKSLNYYLENSAYAAQIFGLLYESLLGTDPETGEDAPGLASAWTVSDDGLTFTFTIDPEARWSDGKPVCAEDVRWTFDAIMAPTNMTGAMKVALAPFRPPEILAPDTIRFTAAEPHWRNLGAAGGFVILPSHVFRNRDFNQLNFDFPVVSGPYKLEAFRENISLTLKRRPDWWAAGRPANQGLFNFDRIEFRHYGSQENAYDAFRKGLLDVYSVYTASIWVRETRGERFDKNWILKRAVRNQKPQGFQGFAMNLRRPPLDDVRVRRALAHLLDRETLNRSLMFSQYFLHRSYWEDLYGPEHPCTNPFYEYNPEKATALLREAGWEMNPQTGILEKDGKPFVLTFLSNGASQEKFLARFRTALRQAGIILQSERKDWAGWARDMDVYQFDISWCAWSSGLRKDPEGMWSGKQINEPGGNNITGFSDARVDGLIAAQRTLFDLSARNEICREIDRILTEQVPYILLWNTDRTNLLWWNKFGVPPSILSRFGDASDAIALWWHDADAADALRDAMETGAALPDAF